MIFTLLFIGYSCAQDKKSSWVLDYENVLSDSEEYTLDSIIKDFELKTSNEIAIVTIKDLEGYPKMVDYAVKFGEKHGVGKKDKNNGLVIVFSQTLRQTFLATGYGTEKILKDEICKEIVDSTMIPHFKQGDSYGGLKAGLLECIDRWE